MTKPDGKKLNRPFSRSTAADGGGCLFFFGLIFVAAGLIPILMAVGVLPINPEDKNVPHWVPFSAGGIFVMAGMIVIGNSIRAMARRRQLREREAANPNEPWFWDYGWDQRRTSDDGGRRTRQAWFGAIILGIFLTPFNAVFMIEKVPFFVRGIIGFFDLLLLLVLGLAIHQLLQRMKYGSSYIRYDVFPIPLGRQATFFFSNARGIGSFDSFEATLRCIQERIIETGSGEERSRQTHYFELHAESIKIGASGHHRGGNRELELPFQLPEGDYSTHLRSPEPRYWELELLAKTPGVDYCARFILPVYGAVQGAVEPLPPSVALAK
jgi:hypothetical protein